MNQECEFVSAARMKESPRFDRLRKGINQDNLLMINSKKWIGI